ncbi:MAG: hypothetical protein VB099_02045 [Candidatus Limiplasma sp.]|nr:hypothetical protein [Candidatus Limiplasma sp.]
MKGNCYFEDHPWQQACKRFLAVDTARGVAEVTVQCACPKGGVEQVLARWNGRLQELLGPVAFEDRQEAQGVRVILRRYLCGAIVRIFLDEGEDLSENFEIAGKKCLILWRPDSRPQAHVTGIPEAFCDCAQLYAADLEVL